MLPNTPVNSNLNAVINMVHWRGSKIFIIWKLYAFSVNCMWIIYHTKCTNSVFIHIHRPSIVYVHKKQDRSQVGFGFVLFSYQGRGTLFMFIGRIEMKVCMKTLISWIIKLDILT